MKKHLLPIIFLILSFVVQAQDRSNWFEFYLPWTDSTKTITDMSGYLDAPAGKYGFLKVTPDGHFRFENKDENQRFVGVVNVAVSNFPTKNEAKIIAARMAKFGINLVRIHLIDVEGNSGLFQNSASNTLEFSADRLDKMDYFIYCLKQKGIYFNFCIHAGRIYKTADGIDSPVINDQSKYVTLFDPKIIALQKDFAQKTIGHTNPYTKLSYSDDPAMVSVELTNENSLFNGWLGWQPDFLFGETTKGIGIFYSNKLDTLFNHWLAKKYATDDELETAWSGGDTVTSVELIKNGSFEQNLSNWSTLVAGGANATIVADATNAKHGTKSVKTTVTKTGTENWNIQLKSNNFRVEKGKDYKIGFYTKADVEKEVVLEVMENQSWKWVIGPVYKTSSDWKYQDFFFNASFTTDQLLLAFGWGKQTGTFWIDSVTVTQTTGVGLENVESLIVGNIRRIKNTELGKYTPQRIGDNAAFYFDTEKNYTQELSGFLKTELNVKCPVTFTNNYYGLSSIYSQAQADYIDFHMYWDHPGFPNGWSELNFTMNNKSILLNPEGSTINKMALTRVKNMPQVLSEYNHPYPYIFQGEAPSLLYAYGSFLNLDGIMWHAYYDYMNRFSQRYQDMFFDIAMHPVMMTQMLLALPYRMNYIKPAQTYVEAFYKEQDVFSNSKFYKEKEVINIENAAFGTSFLQHGFQHASFTADTTKLTGKLANTGKVVESETGELKWDGTQGFFTVNSPYWQGATGYLGGKTIELKNITISKVTTTDNLNFASVQLISLDSLPIEQSKKMILLTSGRLENQGLKWNDAKTSLVSAGGTKALCEPVQATITMKNASADSVSVFVLGTTGLRTDTLLATQNATNATFELNKKTLWYEIGNHYKRVVSPVIDRKIQNEGAYVKSFPNPADQTTTLEFMLPDVKEATLLVYNILGQIVETEPVVFESNRVQVKKLDVSGYSEGIYLWGFRLNTGEFIFNKLVVKN